MRVESIGTYDIEYAGVQAANGDGWTAQVSIYGPSPNPMHRHAIVRDRRVSVEAVFPSEEEAEAEARRVALEMIG